ncbi:MAG: hypothetical protein AUK03_17270 [Anaerolineae bacterium CG2_30_64_16]|nr:MAG: hypothetical protein AUK03_17270 [Anaerolineae bacterium CG2_30_64_16]
MTNAGRSPDCSDPTTGSSRTRTISLRLGLNVKGTVHLLFQWMVFSFDCQIHVCHRLATFDNLLPQALSPLLVEPFAQQFVNGGAAPARYHGLFKSLECICRKCIGALK